MAWAAFFNVGLPLLLIVVGYVVGRTLEQRHLQSIRARERDLLSIVALNTRYVPGGIAVGKMCLVSGSVVISSDYFKTFVAGFRTLVGGRFRGYESMLERARREALVRMKAQARAQGCGFVIGVRLHATQVAGSKTPSVEVMAYGTAVRAAP